MTEKPVFKDLYCAQAGREAAEKAKDKGKRLFSAAALLLQERGLYDVFLYLQKEDQEVGDILFRFLAKYGPAVGLDVNKDKLPQIIDDFADRLTALIQAKALLSRALDYACAHSKSVRETHAQEAG
jgi:hypothetical protein